VTKKIKPPFAMAYPQHHFFISDRKFSRIEKCCKISLDDRTRREIRIAQIWHLNGATVEENAQEVRPVKLEIERMRTRALLLARSIENVAAASEKFNASNQIVVKSLGSYNFGWTQLKDLAEELHKFATACEQATGDLVEAAYGGDGPTGRPHFKPYVCRLANLFEAAGGNAAANSSPNMGGRCGPFVRFVALVSSGMPKSLRPMPGSTLHRRGRARLSALGDAIKLALRQRNITKVPTRAKSAKPRKRSLAG
jgi:hypothetical protein